MPQQADSTYYAILLDTQMKKKHVLDRLLMATKEQEGLFLAERFDYDAFEALVQRKTRLITELQELDTGFEAVYSHIREEIAGNGAQHKETILQLQQLIQEITDRSIAIQTMEESNKRRFETVMLDKRQELKSYRVSSRTAAAYYKNMSNQHNEGQSYFLDKKK